uniref:H(+)-transporting two-sector ATPase n=1 Tax=Balanophora laxiflora TaxID=1128103 RepID=A0A3Q9JN69_9MAGN|nr:ATPase subunit 8 [Balanophora laxiflora]UPI48997.1 ATPase subunit 8 [Balanophora laxiflora]
MPQLDPFTYFTQFFWSCLFIFTLYIFLCNDGVLKIGRIIKLRNRLVFIHSNYLYLRPRSNDLEDISIKGFSTGVSYMYFSLSKVSQWCKDVYLSEQGGKITTTMISCFGEISGSRGMEKNILYLISKSSSPQHTARTKSSTSSRIRNNENIMLIHVPHGQGSILFF